MSFYYLRPSTQLIFQPYFQKYHDNAFVIPKDVKIKKEPMENRINVEDRQSMNTEVRIKTEPVDEHQVAGNEHFPLVEKKKLINKIMQLRSDNERFVVNLKQAEEKCKTFASENVLLKDKIYALSTEMNDLRSKLSACASERSNEKKNIANLIRQKRSLEAVAKQIKTGSATSVHNGGEKSTVDKFTDDESADDEYEVEQIVAHQKKKDGMHYRVRWKGFGESGDTWERESNLHCPLILKKYLEMN